MFKSTLLGSLCSVLLTTQAFAADNNLPEPFQGQSSDSVYEISYDDINIFLRSQVLVNGMSTRQRLGNSVAKTGTRLKNRINRKTALEGNRFLYENLEDEGLLSVVSGMKESLASVPDELPLSALSTNEQLAYWLNLYNLTILEQTAKALPFSNTYDLLTPGKDKYLMDKKVVTVAGVALSLNDIQFSILKEKSDSNPLIIYGLYQGNIGSPSLQPRAFTGKNLWAQLTQSANEFVNSNRGTYYDGRISAFYQQNMAYFNNDVERLRSHLLDYVHGDVGSDIANADELSFTMTDWQLASVNGNERNYGGSINTNAAALGDMMVDDGAGNHIFTFGTYMLNEANINLNPRTSPEMIEVLKRNIYKANEIRAKVEVSDLDSAEEGSSSEN